MSSSPLAVLIIGAGQIGAFYDAPGSLNVLTHAHAFSSVEGFRLVGFVDADPLKGKEAAKRWNTQYFASIEEAFRENRIDVVSVAVPDHCHAQVLESLLPYPIKLVFAEKPFCGDEAVAGDLLARFAQKGVSVQVNYSRRFAPEFRALADKIQSGAFGRCLGGSGYYGKGFVHNGSHMVNLLQYLFGGDAITPGAVFGSLTDAYPKDPTLSLQMMLPGDAPFTLLAADSRAVTLFEFDLLFERQRVRMLKSGFLFYYFDTADNEMFAGYRNYVMRETVETRLGEAMCFAAENIRAHLVEGAPLLSPAISAIETISALSLMRRAPQKVS